MQEPYSLLDIMRLFNATKLILNVYELTQLSDICNEGRRSINADPASRKPDQALLEKILRILKESETLCSSANFANASRKLQLINEHLEETAEEHADYSSLEADIRNAMDVIGSDILKHKFVHISESYVSYLNNDEGFGPDVYLAFPSARTDIRDAGNCIAGDLGTASVFHLMRAVEWSLRAFCRHLGIRAIPSTRKPGKKKKYIPIEYNQWERMLEEANDRVDAKINKMSAGQKKQEAQQFYYPLLKDYKGFKDAWRNHCMHTREEYSTPSAEAICEHVKAFMKALSTRVTES